MGRKAAFLIRLVLTLCISCIMGVLTVLPYYRLPPEHFPADGMFCYWAALFLLPVLSLLLMGHVRKSVRSRRAYWRASGWVWLACCVLLLILYELLLHRAVPNEVWLTVGRGQTPVSVVLLTGNFLAALVEAYVHPSPGTPPAPSEEE